MNRNYYIKQIRDLSKNYDRDAQSKILDELTDKFFDVDGIKELYDILMEEVYVMEESKDTKMTVTVRSERIINDFLKNEKPKWLATCRKVNRYTRAGKDGKFIVCPHCDQGNFVFHFMVSTQLSAL